MSTTSSYQTHWSIIDTDYKVKRENNTGILIIISVVSWATTIVFHIQRTVDYYTTYFISYCATITSCNISPTWRSSTSTAYGD